MYEDRLKGITCLRTETTCKMITELLSYIDINHAKFYV